MRSVYRRLRSTETTVLKIYNEQLTTEKCLLDLTAAFSTIDHDLMMLKLECQFGLCGVVLGLVQVISLRQNLSSHPRWQEIIYCSRYMFRASRFCSRAVYVYSIRSSP